MAAKRVEGETFLNAEEVAGLLKIKPRTALSLAHERRLPCVRLGRLVRFPRSVIERWMLNHVIPSDERFDWPDNDLGGSQPSGSPA